MADDGSTEKNQHETTGNVREKLKQIKHALSQESEQTKEMMEIYRRSLKKQATAEEMAIANTQFKDLLKALGLGILAVLPLGTITIPAVVLLGKKYDIEVLPDSFRDV